MDSRRLDRGPVGYVLDFFPQLSETFIENEIRALRALGTDVVAFVMYHPASQWAGETALPTERIFYRPGPLALSCSFVRWAVLRPAATLRNIWRALSLRSQTMLRAAWSAGWVANGLRAHGARHIHAHFAHDAACTAMAAAELTGLTFTFTVHAHDMYLRTNGLSLRCSKAARVVTVCEYNIGQLRARCPSLPESRIELVYCGVDPAAFRTGARPENEVPRLLSVGRLVDIKGFPDLIRAAGLLRTRGRSFTLDIVGHGPRRSELEALVADLGLGDVISFTGPLTPGEVAARMAGADVFVLACRIDADGNRDSMPVVVKEAMASGLPVVSTREVAVPEMVDDEVGRLANPDDPESLAAAIEEVLALTAEQRRAMGVNGRRRVEERFNLWSEAAKMAAMFDRLSA